MFVDLSLQVFKLKVKGFYETNTAKKMEIYSIDYTYTEQ